MSDQDTAASNANAYLTWRRRVFAGIWLTYASFYLARVNWAGAQKAMQTALGLSKAQLGHTLSAFRLVYGFSQLVNGQLADRFGPRVMIAIGVVGSVAVNITIGLGPSYRVIQLLWLLNGFFQACGWSSVMSIFAGWYPADVRGRASGWLSTSYLLGNAASWSLAGFLAQRYGWRAAFLLPAALFGVAGLGSMLLWQRRPSDVGLEDIFPAQRRPSFRRGLMRTLTNRAIWCAALTWLLLSVGIHSLLDWLPQFLAEQGGLSVGAAAARASLVPIFGAVGAVALGWATDRWFAGRRAPLLVGVMLLLAVLLVAMPVVTASNPATGIALLPLLGFTSQGPAAMITSALAVDAGRPEAAGGAAGFVDAMGYLGGAISTGLSGQMMDLWEQTVGPRAAWQRVWWLWAAGVLAAALMLLGLWRLEPQSPDD